MLEDWRPPPHWKAITTIDAHTAGEPLRIITGGLPRIPGNTILEKRRYFLEKMDHFRKGLIWEPRGHADMYGAVITEPVTSEADLGVLFLHNEGLSTMCGHGIIALATVVVETGEMPVKAPFTEVRMDTPAGLITAYAKVEGSDSRNVQKTRFGERDAVIPEVEGSAYITGKHQFLFDPDDPLASGFFLR